MKTTEKNLIVNNNDCQKICCGKNANQSNSGSAIYGMGMIGALVYFYPQMIGFVGTLAAIGKSIIWPALLVFQALSLLKL